MAQNSDSRKVTVASTPDDSEALRAAAIVADASRALWVDDATLALTHIAELLVAEGLAARAVVDVTDEGTALRGEARGPAVQGPPSGTVSVPVVASQRTIGSISVDLPSEAQGTPAYVTALLKQLAQFIGPAVAAHRTRVGERTRLADENTRLRSRLHGRHDLTSVIGNSEAMRQVCEMVSRAAPTGTPVLLEGEAGTGKEFLARTLHHSSPWARKPFVEYSCSRAGGGNIEADLLELFRGRDAHKKRPPLADGGTLFLDDVHELPAAAQAQLMRVLQQREFAPGHASSSPGPHVRVLATSETSLESAVTANRFRADVFHRLSGFSIAVPRLQDRQADIPLLADFFLAKFACDHGKNASRISARALDMLTRYSWPGHVRELANVIERAVLLCDDAVVHGHHLSPAIHAAEGGGAPSPFSLSESLDAYEKDLLLDALRAARGVRSRAARLLQTTDRIFNYKVRKHAIDCRRFKS
ncbi:MAG TPA: sigma 54-interacting transcriptional regulator [Vicinamibacterales bacterium]|nr:sigma 54-interacting transcriptional regulator [Vicinamibacterales bacterium]